MKITRTQLQNYFETPLPSIEEIADAFTFHAFEIDAIEGDLLDVKVLPNRAADCNSEEGLARELAAILDVPTTVQPEGGALARVSATLAQINGILGADFAKEEVEGVFKRLQLPTEVEGETFIITPPANRPDLTIPEDLAEEVGQILGYDRIEAKELPFDAAQGKPDQARYRGVERMKDQLVEQGYIEVSTQSFASVGDVELANPLDKSKPMLRTTLEENLKDSLEKAKQYAALVLPPGQKPKLFEVGSVFPKSGEYLELRMTERVKEWGDAAGTSDNLTVAKLEDYGKEYEPVRYELGAYKPFSLYPFITRDIALWVPAGIEAATIENSIRENAGELLVRLDQFDTFEKEGRVSYGFRLVFQAMDRTLTDDEVGGLMTAITAAFTAQGYEVR